MKVVFFLVVATLIFHSSNSSANSCEIAVTARGEFGIPPYKEKFKNKVNALLEKKGYVVIGHDFGRTNVAQVENRLHINADYGFPCATGVSTAEMIFMNFSYAYVTLEKNGEQTRTHKTIWNFPPGIGGKKNVQRAVLKSIKKLPDCE